MDGLRRITFRTKKPEAHAPDHSGTESKLSYRYFVSICCKSNRRDTSTRSNHSVSIVKERADLVRVSEVRGVYHELSGGGEK